MRDFLCIGSILFLNKYGIIAMDILIGFSNNLILMFLAPIHIKVRLIQPIQFLRPAAHPVTLGPFSIITVFMPFAIIATIPDFINFVQLGQALAELISIITAFYVIELFFICFYQL